MKFLTGTLVFLATAYLAVLVILWAFQARFLYPAPQSAASLTPGYEEVQVETSDGLRLRSFYRAAEEGRPTVVYFHGNAGTLGGAVVSNNAIVEAGVGALLIEYRGYGGNQGEPSEEGFYRDGEAAMAWLSARDITPAQTIIIGNSIGSGVATEMALQHDPLALILIAPFRSLPDAAAENLWWLPVRQLMRDRFNNFSKLPRIDGAILVQHGTADTLIPPSHGRALADAAPSAQFQAFEGAGHDLSFMWESQELRRDWILALGSGDIR